MLGTNQFLRWTALSGDSDNVSRGWSVLPEEPMLRLVLASKEGDGQWLQGENEVRQNLWETASERLHVCLFQRP